MERFPTGTGGSEVSLGENELPLVLDAAFALPLTVSVGRAMFFIEMIAYLSNGWISSLGRAFTIFIVSRLTVMIFRNKSSGYRSLPISVA